LAEGLSIRSPPRGRVLCRDQDAGTGIVDGVGKTHALEIDVAGQDARKADRDQPTLPGSRRDDRVPLRQAIVVLIASATLHSCQAAARLHPRLEVGAAPGRAVGENNATDGKA
jgi:hypothetical protein